MTMLLTLDDDKRKQSEMERQKVIGVGFHKTGTTTLGVCLKTLGYRHESVRKDTFQMYLRKDFEGLFGFLDNIDSCEDWPWPLIYRELYARYPDAKFILTVRKSTEAWFNSVNKHVQRGAGNGFKYRKYIYGSDTPAKSEDIYVERYDRHNSDVRIFFKEKGADFLELCWENGDGWDELCKFLSVPVPNIPFPQANSNPGQFRGRLGLLYRGGRKLMKLIS